MNSTTTATREAQALAEAQRASQQLCDRLAAVEEEIRATKRSSEETEHALAEALKAAANGRPTPDVNTLPKKGRQLREHLQELEATETALRKALAGQAREVDLRRAPVARQEAEEASRAWDRLLNDIERFAGSQAQAFQAAVIAVMAQNNLEIWRAHSTWVPTPGQLAEMRRMFAQHRQLLQRAGYDL